MKFDYLEFALNSAANLWKNSVYVNIIMYTERVAHNPWLYATEDISLSRYLDWFGISEA